MQSSDYYFGLDIGTDSVGAAATDENYNLLRYKGNAMWFVKLFDESLTAAERRSYRTATRRTQRKRERIALLQMLFDKAVCEKDETFFQRLKESNLYAEDKTIGTPYSVFADTNYTDKDFHKEFPTVYHLRKKLITSTAVHDVRLVYLAVHHLIKHRGHFLFDIGSSELQMDSFGLIFGELQNFLSDEYDIELPCDDADVLADILKDRKLSCTRKCAAVLSLCGIRRKDSLKEAAILSLLCGKTEKAADIFDEEIEIENKPLKLQLGGNYDDNATIYERALGDRFALMERLKAVYDWTVLADILDGEKYISFAKVKSYDKHKNDLKMLKKYVKEYCPEKYNEIFKESRDKLNNYTAYSGMIKQNGKTGVLHNVCDAENFYDYLKKIFKDLPHDGYEMMFAEIEAKTFMPKQHIKDNGVIPMQLNRMELKKILKNASTYLPFLEETDEKGRTISEKILDIFDYRIPYYVGPLNKNSDKAWLERTSGKIYPWNFSEIVNVDVSAENFINNLTSKCTYLPTEDVIPKNSVLYCKFTVLNELNNLRINSEKISVRLKQSIYNDLFLKRKKVTVKGLLGYLKSQGISDAEISGIDVDFKSNMRPYLDLSPYGLTEEEMDRVITAITIFDDDKKLLKKRLREQLGDKLSDTDIGRIGKLSYSGWGRLSEKFLRGIYAPNPETGELFNLIEALWETNDNLMILLGSKYGFYDSLQKEFTIDTEKSLKEIVNSLYVSPKVKRPIFQSIKMLQEVVKVTGKPPKKIFVEMTRGDGKKGERKESRKENLMKLYRECKLDSGELFKQLEGTDNDTLRRDKLYLYYTQFGKCMYTGEDINFNSLFDSNIYDIDHIFPRSKVKDDSIDNRVLVKKQINAGKDNIYPLSEDIRHRMYAHWKFLYDKELISKEKFKRLTRNEPLTDDELSDFISRQLVETSQSTKAVAQILSQLYPESDIVYVKARIVSEFRKRFDMLKCRDVNDLHHAKDAYLNIVVGNVY
ncbi:MAG: type II CRISPR RNA-guided endonuclease Cas9, partial [Lachnospiraceae bacterium]|nr:type II CRISPR RNA-guided endonuclease Cas9 [Lachnospiraceae bacterium]